MAQIWKLDKLLDTIKFEVEMREMSEATQSNASKRPNNKKRLSEKPSSVRSLVVTKGERGQYQYL